MKLENKTILVLSSENWGKMLLSKHHYAIELARKGNTVYFLNPPGKEMRIKSKFNYRLDSSTKGVTVIDQYIYFPYDIRFHAPGIFKWLMKWHIKQLLKSINKPIDIIWSFDLQGLYSLKDFPASMLKLYFPADEPIIPNSINASNGADVLVSITKEIIGKFNKFKESSFLLNHGLAAEFLVHKANDYVVGSPKSVGISGNFLRNDIDREILFNVIKENPDIIFECWGSYAVSHSNIGGSTSIETVDFIKALQFEPNVIMHGIVNTSELSAGINRMDAFLICYDIRRDQSKGTNYHKIMEYLSTGKVIISNNVTAYEGKGKLVAMASKRNSNDELPGLFREVINNLDYWNSTDLIAERKQFAEENRYSRQIDKLTVFLNERVLKGKISVEEKSN